MAKIFITGVTGFVGKSLLERLRDDNDLLLLSRAPGKLDSLQASPGIKILEGDLSDADSWKAALKRFKPDAAVHLAWEGIPDYSAEMSAKNLVYGIGLINALAETGCKSVICSGSCWEYGEQSGEVNEDTVVNPYNAFTAAKNSLHWIGREIARENGMSFIWARFFYVYGPGQRETSLIPYIIGNVKNGKIPELKTPSAKNDFVYVEDVARAIVSLLDKPTEYGVYNIGSGVATEVRRIVEIICEKFEFSCKIDLPDKAASGPFNFRADTSRIKRDTGWQPEVNIEEGIRKTIDYFLNRESDEV